MSRTTVTLDLPSEVYNQLQQRAHQHRRGLEDEAGITLAAAVGASAALPEDLEIVLDSLAALDDATLLRLSHSQPTVEDGILFQALIEKRRQIGLSVAEEQWLADLGERHDRVMVLRARAVALLHDRGVDVAERVARA
jgi:plasmid stability protein